MKGMDGMLFTALPIFMMIVLPGVFIFVLWRAAFKSKLEWGMDAGSTIFLIAWLFQSGQLELDWHLGSLCMDSSAGSRLDYVLEKNTCTAY